MTEAKPGAKPGARPVAGSAAGWCSNGLATLRQRLAEDGGELQVEQEDGRFLTAAWFPVKMREAGR